MAVSPSTTETISATQCRPNYIPAFSTTILNSKQEALTATINHHKMQVSVYSDGSGFENRVGTSAIMYINSVEKRTLQYYLGPLSNHTVYEGEIVGLTLALHLLKSPPVPISFIYYYQY